MVLLFHSALANKEIIKKSITVLLCIFCCVFSLCASGTSEEQLYVSFLDVGQGDATLIKQGNHCVLIDGGENPQVIHSILENKGISNIEVVIASHNDSDHIGGLADVLKFRNVKKLYLSQDEKIYTKSYENMILYAKSNKTKILYPKTGDSIKIGKVKITFIGPISKYNNSNDSSLCTRIDYGSTSFLLMGDSSIDVEDEIIDINPQAVNCTVLKVNHHGAEHSTGYRLLREAKPNYAIISVGNNNYYGHPSESVISRLYDYKRANPFFTLYRTDMQGTITFTSDGTKIVEVDVEKNEYSSNVYKEKN